MTKFTFTLFFSILLHLAVLHSTVPHAPPRPQVKSEFLCLRHLCCHPGFLACSWPASNWVVLGRRHALFGFLTGRTRGWGGTCLISGSTEMCRLVTSSCPRSLLRIWKTQCPPHSHPQDPGSVVLPGVGEVRGCQWTWKASQESKVSTMHAQVQEPAPALTRIAKWSAQKKTSLSLDGLPS